MCGLYDLAHRQKTVDLVRKLLVADWNPVLLQPPGISFAFIAEHVVARGQYQGRRHAREIGSPQRGGSPIVDITGPAQILVVKPLDCRAG